MKDFFIDFALLFCILCTLFDLGFAVRRILCGIED